MKRHLDVFRCEVRREGKGKPQLGGKSRAEIARTEEIERNIQPSAWNGLDTNIRPGEVRLQLDHVLRKCVAAAAEAAAQSASRSLIAPGRAAETEIDPAGIEGFERAKLFGNHERRVIRQHDSAGADSNRFRLT